MHHQQNVGRASEFIRRDTNPKDKIKYQMNTLRMQEVKENREALENIINALKIFPRNHKIVCDYVKHNLLSGTQP